MENMSKKELYNLDQINGLTNEEIAEKYNVKVATIDRAIGRLGYMSIRIGPNGEEYHVCSDCGAPFVIYPSEKEFYNKKGLLLPKRCPICRKKRAQFERRTCVDCGDPFDISTTQKAFFESKGLALPKRCPKCRAKRKEADNIEK